MDTKTILTNFEQTAGIWLAALDNYSEEDLKLTPALDSWSLGQVYRHLFQSAMFFQLGNVDFCTGSSENADGKKTEAGEKAFMECEFPPVEIKVPPSDRYTPKQPEDKAQIKKDLTMLIERMKTVPEKLENATHHGKALHPALGYLNAIEWYQLIDMHFRHHMRQKEKLEKLIEPKK